MATIIARDPSGKELLLAQTCMKTKWLVATINAMGKAECIGKLQNKNREEAENIIRNASRFMIGSENFTNELFSAIKN